MSAIARRAALRATFRPTARAPTLRQAGRRNASAEADVSASKQNENKEVLKEGARRDPELYILLTIMTGAFTLAGWHFSRNPTSSSSENKILKAEGSEPWNTGSNAKYQYHPGGDASRGKKDAPSALNEVVIPNVNLPKSLHEKYNKWGKEGF